MNSLPRRFSGKVDFNGQCWMWKNYKDKDGYGQYSVKSYPIQAHRFSWIHFNGEIPDGLCILHKCDTPACVNPTHLFLGTKRDNAKDMASKQRNWSTKYPELVPKKESHWNAKLTQADVDEIRKLYRKGNRWAPSEFDATNLAKKFGVHKVQINKIVNQERWSIK